MANYAEYFLKNRYVAKYDLGDRVEGKWNGVPFVGMVGNDRVVSEETGPEVTIHLDLPILHGGKVHNILLVKHKSIKKRK